MFSNFAYLSSNDMNNYTNQHFVDIFNLNWFNFLIFW